MKRKIDNSYQSRMDGMAYALKIAKEKGVEELEKEIRFRNAHYVPLEISREELMDIYGLLSNRITETLLTMVMATLRDWKGFGKKRLEEFRNEFTQKCMAVDARDPFGQHYARISDYAEVLREECGIEMDIQTLRKVEEDNDRRERMG